MRKITIKRPKRFEGAIVRWSIWLDGRMTGKIANGQTMTLEMDEKEHRIELRGGMFTDTLFDKVTIPSGKTEYCFQIDLIGVQTVLDVAPLFRPVPGMGTTVMKHEATVLRAGTMVAKQLLNSQLLDELRHSATAFLQLVFDETRWTIELVNKAVSRSVYSEQYYRFSGWETKVNPWKALPIDHSLNKAVIKEYVLRNFVAYLPDYQVKADGRIVPSWRTMSETNETGKVPQQPAAPAPMPKKAQRSSGNDRNVCSVPVRQAGPEHTESNKLTLLVRNNQPALLSVMTGHDGKVSKQLTWLPQSLLKSLTPGALRVWIEKVQPSVAQTMDREAFLPDRPVAQWCKQITEEFGLPHRPAAKQNESPKRDSITDKCELSGNLLNSSANGEVTLTRLILQIRNDKPEVMWQMTYRRRYDDPRSDNDAEQLPTEILKYLTSAELMKWLKKARPKVADLLNDEAFRADPGVVRWCEQIRKKYPPAEQKISVMPQPTARRAEPQIKLTHLFDSSKNQSMGQVYSFVGVDLNTNTFYEALSMLDHIGGAYFERIIQVSNPLTAERLRKIAHVALDKQYDHPENIMPYVDITDDGMIQKAKELAKPEPRPQPAMNTGKREAAHADGSTVPASRAQKPKPAEAKPDAAAEVKDQPDWDLRNKQKMTAIVSRTPALADIRKDPQRFNREAEALLRRLAPMAWCKTELDASDPSKPPRVILRSNLRSALFMRSPDELLAEIGRMPFAEQCMLCKVLCLENAGQIEGNVDPVQVVFGRTRAMLSTEELLASSDPKLLCRFIAEATEKKTSDRSYLALLQQALVKSLFSCSKLYVAYDQLIREGRYPYIQLNGRALLFTERELAYRMVPYCEQNRLGRISIKKLEPGEYADFFDSLNEIAPHVLVNNGDVPADLPVSLLKSGNIPDLVNGLNCSVRGLALREMGIGARMSEFPVEEGTPEYKNIVEWMMTVRLNGYAGMGRSLFYAFTPRNGRSDDATYATPAAKEYGGKIAQEYPDSSMQAPDTTSLALYEDQLSLRVVNKPGESEVSQGEVCVFSSRKAALECLADFRNRGCDDLPVIITFDELMKQAQSCAGILLDMNGLGMIYPRSQFARMMDVASMKFNGPIMFRLNTDAAKKV